MQTVDPQTSQLPLWAGIGLGTLGSLLASIQAVVTAESVSGGLVAVGGVAIVAYGILQASKDKAYRRAIQQRDEAWEELETLKREVFGLRADKAYCEKHHDPITPYPS